MRILLLTAVLFVCSAINADEKTLQSGYYRVYNKASERYVYVCDNTGSINVQTTSADMGAIQLWKEYERTISDPASIIYVNNLSGGLDNSAYDIGGQGTSIHKMIGHYVQLYPEQDSDAWKLFVTQSGLVKYLADDETSDSEYGRMGTNAKGEYRKWVAVPIDLERNYFGVQPKFSIGEKYYKPFYADFAFSFAGTGMKAYYISEIYKHIAVIKEVEDEVIAANTPVIIECSAAEASANKLNLYLNQGGHPEGNLMKGIYFNNPYRPKSPDARTKFDPSCMRVLGILEDGTLGFVHSDETHLTSNEAYLTVPADAPEELVVMTEDELAAYKDFEAGINYPADKKSVSGVYSITGLKIADKMHPALPKGVYIVNGRKVTKP